MLFGLGVLHAGDLAVEKKKFLVADKALNEAYQSAKKIFREVDGLAHTAQLKKGTQRR
jgi:hypothetical protein